MVIMAVEEHCFGQLSLDSNVREFSFESRLGTDLREAASRSVFVKGMARKGREK